MLDLGRVWKLLGRDEDADFVLLAASRGGPPRVAERARELLPDRYPYVYEFEKALELDPSNFELRREYAYLLLAMGKQDEAEHQFEALHQADPNDLLTSAQLGFLLLNRQDPAGAQPLLDQVLKGDDEELADRARVALKLPQTLEPPRDFGATNLPGSQGARRKEHEGRLSEGRPEIPDHRPGKRPRRFLRDAQARLGLQHPA